MKNPYDILLKQGVAGARTIALPNNYQFELTMDTWWSAVQRARLYSDFTGLDALYSYIMKSSTIVRSAVDKRLRPLKFRTFGVYFDDVEDERLTKVFKDSALVRSLIKEKGLANFTYARVIGVDNNGETYVTAGKWYVKSHVNLFWVQTDYDSEDTLGLLEPIARDYINMVNSQNNWQTASQFQAYQQMVMYYENGDEAMEKAATDAAANVGLGQVIVSGKVTDEMTGKSNKLLELENVYGNSAADTFRIFKENIEGLRASIMQLVLGSSLLGLSDKNTNSERLVRAHLKLFRDICESDAEEVQDWLNKPETLTKLAYLLNEPELVNAKIRVKPADYIDIGDIEVFTKMLKDLGLYPTESFVEKAGLSADDVKGYKDDEELKNVDEGGAGAGAIPKERNAARRFASMVMDGAKRLFNGNRPDDGD